MRRGVAGWPTCRSEKIAFVLGHALYMKAIHGGKAKNDRIDALKIATLLRGGMIPQAYVYPPEMRATRDLLRRRLHFRRKRSELLAHIHNTNSQYNLPEFDETHYAGERPAVPDPNSPETLKALLADCASFACVCVRGRWDNSCDNSGVNAP